MTHVRISLLAAGATLIALGAGACGDITENGDPDKNDNGGDARNAAEVHDDPAALGGRTFVSTEVSTGPADTPAYLAEMEVELAFDKKAQRFEGGVGCNGMFGKVSADGGTLSMDGVGRTEMACQQPLMRQENWLVDLLESEPSWELTEDDKLRISSKGTELVLAEEKEPMPENPGALRDVNWQLDGVTEDGSDPNGSSWHSRAMEQTELIFAPVRDESRGGQDRDGQDRDGQDRDGKGQDGQGPTGSPGERDAESFRVQGTGGCNGFGGRATVTPAGPEGPDSQTPSEYDGTIRFGKLAGTLKACTNEEIMRVENAMLDTLKGEVPYTLTEDSLTLHGKHELTFSAH